MISHDDAMTAAVAALTSRPPHPTLALAWIAYAAETRRAPGPEARLTLHDVDVRRCSHDKIAVRDRRTDSSWWLHTDDHTHCDLE